MSTPGIPFSRPYRSDRELDNLRTVLESGHVHGDGAFTRSSTGRLQSILNAEHVLLTTSGSHALELASLLLGLGPGDEVILPSFTFASAANAIALTGAEIVFVDSDPRTGNVDPAQVEAAITVRTKAISYVHYGGVAAEVEALEAIAADHGLDTIEDNAHGLGGAWRGRPLGTFGRLAIQSFHDTKNIHCGEGGAIVINDATLRERAEIIREKGTNRSRFLRGQVDKYSWVDLGSSYLPSELSAAVLDSQLASFEYIQAMRHRVWARYNDELAQWRHDQHIGGMHLPEGSLHPAHLHYVLMPDHRGQTALIEHLRERGVAATFHFVPLDTSDAGRRWGRAPAPCVQAEAFSSRLVRLPLWAGMTEEEVTRVIDAVMSYESD